MQGGGGGLSGRRALVTGGSRGIGRAIAAGLAAAGASLVLHGAREHATEAMEAAGALDPAGGRAIALDLDEAGAGARLGQEAGMVDVLVASASVEVRAPWHVAGAADTARQLGVNVAEMVGLLQAVVPGMTERGWGRVLLVGSVQSLRGNPELMVYAATKAALASIGRTLAREVAGAGVTVNVLSPGAIETQRNAAVLADPARRSAALARIPAGRFGRPEDCVALAVLLCSDAGGYVTGQEIRVDGGMSL